jgi:hypothetical protein
MAANPRGLFGGLPLELRNEVYLHYLDPTASNYHDSADSTNTLSLLRTSKAIHDETTAILYFEHIFPLDLRTALPPFSTIERFKKVCLILDGKDPRGGQPTFIRILNMVLPNLNKLEIVVDWGGGLYEDSECIKWFADLMIWVKGRLPTTVTIELDSDNTSEVDKWVEAIFPGRYRYVQTHYGDRRFHRGAYATDWDIFDPENQAEPDPENDPAWHCIEYKEMRKDMGWTTESEIDDDEDEF